MFRCVVFLDNTLNCHSIFRTRPYTTKRCSIKLKDEEAVMEVTGSRLEEEANMAEIGED